MARLQLLRHLKLNSKQNKVVRSRTKELVGSGFSEWGSSVIVLQEHFLQLTYVQSLGLGGRRPCSHHLPFDSSLVFHLSALSEMPVWSWISSDSLKGFSWVFSVNTENVVSLPREGVKWFSAFHVRRLEEGVVWRRGSKYFSQWKCFQMTLWTAISLHPLKFMTGAGEIVQSLRPLAAIPEDLGPIPSNHWVVHDLLKLQF